MKHRSETERIALILEAINSNSSKRGETQTRIMYKAYLPYAKLTNICQFCWIKV